MSTDTDFSPPAPDLPRPGQPRRGPNGVFIPYGERRRRAKNGARESHGLGGIRKGALAEIAARGEPLPTSRLDQRTKVAKALRALRASLVEAKGGDERVTPQLGLLIDLVVTDHLLVASADARIRELGERDELFEPPARARFVSLVKERLYLAHAAAGRLAMLGLDPVERPPADLTGYLAAGKPPESPTAASDIDAEAAPATEP